MKLVYLYEIFHISGGIPKIQTLKANYLSEFYGYEVTIITDKKNKDRFFFSLNKNIKIIYLDFSNKFFKNELESTINNIKPDIVSCIADTKEFYFLKKTKRKYKIITEFRTNYRAIRGFSNIKYNFKTWLKERIRLTRFIKAGRNYNRFIVLTNDDKRFFNRYINKITIIPNPIINDNPYNNTFHQSAIAVGRLEGVKGFDKLIDIWKIVSLKHPDWKLNIFGDGPLKNDLNKKIEKLNLNENIIIHQPTNDIFKEYANNSIHLMTSLYEGFGNVLTEAMSSEIPSIAFNCGGGPEDLIDNEKTGFLIPMRNNELFAEKIIQLIEDEDLRKKMGNAAKNKSKNYNLHNIMAKWNELFISLKEKS